jgi:DNA-nicking Smr family endonuclease
MPKIFEDIFIKNYPAIDLHGYDRDTARVAVNDFINENSKLKNNGIVIIHGIGSGIIKDTVHNALKNSDLVIEYRLHSYNLGMTIVKIK